MRKIFVWAAVVALIAPLLGRGAPRKIGVLTDEQVKEMKVEEIDPKTKRGYVFQCSFGQASMTAAEKKKYSRSGKVPFRITCTLYQVRESHGKKQYRRQSGTCRFYLVAPDGEVILSKSASLSVMCPT
jgi:hypothetical protein